MDPEIEHVLVLYRQFEASSEPTTALGGGSRLENGTIQGLYLQYSAVAEAVIEAFSDPYWYPNYGEGVSVKQFETGDFVEHATLQEIKSYVTQLLYGERFVEGTIAAALESGMMRRVIQRLALLNKQGQA